MVHTNHSTPPRHRHDPMYTDDTPTYTWFEKYLCGLSGPSLVRNVRDMALLELAFQCLDAVSLAFTVADEGGLKKLSDQFALFTLIVSAATLGALLWYALRRHPDAHFLHPFNAWCVLMLVVYALVRQIQPKQGSEVNIVGWAVGVEVPHSDAYSTQGVVDDVFWVAFASRKRTWPRTVTLIADIFSLALFCNIVYLNVQLLRRIQQSSAATSKPSWPWSWRALGLLALGWNPLRAPLAR